MSCKKCPSDPSPLHKAASLNHVDCIRALLRDGQDINSRNKEGSTPLHIAAFTGFTQVVEYLISKGATVNAENSFFTTPLHSAAFNGHDDTVKCLLEKGSNVNSRDKDGATALHKATFNGSLHGIELLIRFGADVNAEDKEGATSVHLAAFNGSLDKLEKLCSIEGAKVDKKDLNYATALHKASFGGHTPCATFLINKGLNVESVDRSKMTALHMACFNGHKHTAEMLIKKGAKPSRQDKLGASPLHYASYKGHHEVVVMLLDRDAPVDLEDFQGASIPDWKHEETSPCGFTALHGATYYGQKRVAGLLVSRSATVDAQGPGLVTALHIASIKGELDCAQALVGGGADLDARTVVEDTPLHLAVQNGCLDVAALLIKKGCDVNAVNKDGYNALHMACMSSTAKKMVKFLCENGTDLGAQDKEGKSPLHRACAKGHIRTVHRLIAAGADPNVVDFHNSTPLHQAASSGAIDIVEELLKLGGRVNAQDNSGVTALMGACLKGKYDIAKLLVNAGASISATDKQGALSIHKAAHNGSVDCLRLLLFKETINQKDWGGLTPLHIASSRGNKDAISYLLRKGADAGAIDNAGRNALHHATATNSGGCIQLLLTKDNIDSIDRQGASALHWAAHHGHTRCASALVKAGANVCAVDSERSSPLHYACISGHPSFVRFLIENKASVDAEDIHCTTPIHQACSYGHQECVEELLGARASYTSVDANGDTPLHTALLSGHFSCVKLLEKCRGFSEMLKMRNKKGNQPLHAAAKGGSSDCVKLLAQLGVPFNVYNLHKKTPLHLACARGHTACVNVLLHRRQTETAEDITAIVRSVDHQGNTPLHAAARGGASEDILISLLKKGADVDAANKANMTPLHSAIAYERVDTLSTLIDHSGTLDWVPANLPTNGASDKKPAYETPRQAGFKSSSKLINQLVDPRLNISAQTDQSLWKSVKVQSVLETLGRYGADVDQNKRPFSKFFELFFETNKGLTRAIFNCFAQTEIEWTAQALLDLYIAADSPLELLKFAIMEEVDNTKEAGTLFRGNNMVNKLLSLYARHIATPYLYATLRPPLEYIASQNRSFEIDPTKATGEDVPGNVSALTEITNNILTSITNSLSNCPRPLRELCNFLKATVMKKFPRHGNSSVGGFVFLRFFMPGVVSPPADLISLSDIPPRSRRGLVLGTKVLQNLSNQVEFGIKEEFMAVMNKFVTSNAPRLEEFFTQIATIPSGHIARATSSNSLQRTNSGNSPGSDSPPTTPPRTRTHSLLQNSNSAPPSSTGVSSAPGSPVLPRSGITRTSSTGPKAINPRKHGVTLAPRPLYAQPSGASTSATDLDKAKTSGHARRHSHDDYINNSANAPASTTPGPAQRNVYDTINRLYQHIHLEQKKIKPLLDTEASKKLESVIAKFGPGPLPKKPVQEFSIPIQPTQRPDTPNKSDEGSGSKNHTSSHSSGTSSPHGSVGKSSSKRFLG